MSNEQQPRGGEEPPIKTVEPRSDGTHALRWLVGGLAIAALVVLVPFWAPLVLAAWSAFIAWPLQQRLSKWSGHRHVVAGAVTTLLVLAILTPLAVAVLSLSASAMALVQKLMASPSGEEALKALLNEGGGDLDFPSSLANLHYERAFAFVRQHGAKALGVARSAFGMATVVVVGIVVFVASFYSFLTEGKQLRTWLLERSPLSHPHFHRLANVFVEVGRGLLVGVGLTALAQGAVATVGYLVTGVPQALVLGLVTTIASLVPSVGAGLVWVPVAAGLALSGRSGAALVMLVIGTFASVIDNLLRPLFARYAALRLHGLVLFLAMLGGIVVLGPWGLILGPLVVRLAIEGLEILREQREARDELERRT